MTPTAAIAAIARYAGQVSGVHGASYPAQVNAATWPHLFLYWDETTVLGSSEQTWAMTVRGELVVPLAGSFPQEVPQVDALIMPLVDAFAVGKPAHRLVTGAESVDYADVRRIVPSVVITMGGQSYYGAQLYWSVKARRSAL